MSWPRPSDPARRWGYAGGLGPANIGQAVAFVEEFRSLRLWLDMESNVRTSNDWLDLDKVRAVCGAVFPDRSRTLGCDAPDHPIPDASTGAAAQG